MPRSTIHKFGSGQQLSSHNYNNNDNNNHHRHHHQNSFIKYFKRYSVIMILIQIFLLLINYHQINCNILQQIQQHETKIFSRQSSNINNNQNDSTISITTDIGTMAPITITPELQQQIKINEKLCQFSDSDSSSSDNNGNTNTNDNSTNHKISIASNCRTLVSKKPSSSQSQQQKQSNIDQNQQPSMMFEVFYSPQNANHINSSKNHQSNQSGMSSIRFQLMGSSSSSNNHTMPFNDLNNKIISPHSLNVKTSPNGEITVINGKTVTSILYEQDHSAIQKQLIAARLMHQHQPSTSSSQLSSTLPTSSFATMTTPSTLTTNRLDSSVSTISSTPTIGSTMNEAESKKQSILLDQNYSKTTPLITTTTVTTAIPTTPTTFIHQNNNNNHHNHNYNNKDEIPFNNHRLLMNSIHQHQKQQQSLQQKEYGSKIFSKPSKNRPIHESNNNDNNKMTTLRSFQSSVRTTPMPSTEEYSPVSTSTTVASTVTASTISSGSTIRDKNRIDYLRQRYNKSVANRTSSTAASITTASFSATTPISTTPTKRPTTTSTTIMMTTASTDEESPIPVYFTTTKPLFRGSNHHHSSRFNKHHQKHQSSQTQTNQIISTKKDTDKNDINYHKYQEFDDDIDEIIMNSTTSKPMLMDIQRLKQPTSTSLNKANQQQQQQSTKPVVRQHEIKWRPYYQRSRTSTTTAAIPSTSTSITPTPPTNSTTSTFNSDMNDSSSSIKQTSQDGPLIALEKEEEKTMMFLPIKNSVTKSHLDSNVNNNKIRPNHRPSSQHQHILTEPFEYPIMNFDHDASHHHTPHHHHHHHHQPKNQPIAPGLTFSTPRSTLVMTSLSPPFFKHIQANDDIKKLSSNAITPQDSLIPSELSVNLPLPDKNPMTELFDQKFNYINEIYRKKTNNPKSLVEQPLVRTSADLIRLAAMRPITPVKVSKNPTNHNNNNNQIRNIAAASNSIAATPQPNLTTPTPMPPPEVFVTIENKFYVLRNNTATVQHPIQDLSPTDHSSVLDTKDLITSTILAKKPLIPSSSSSQQPLPAPPTQQQQSLPPPMSSSSSFNSISSVGNVHLEANFFPSQRLPIKSTLKNNEDDNRIHLFHNPVTATTTAFNNDNVVNYSNQRQQQQQKHSSFFDEYPETLMQFMQKYHQQNNPHHGSSSSLSTMIEDERKQQRPFPISKQQPQQSFILNNPHHYHRRPMPTLGRVNKFNSLSLNDFHNKPQTMKSESINQISSANGPIFNSNPNNDDNNPNPYTLVRHYINTYWPDKAEIPGFEPTSLVPPKLTSPKLTTSNSIIPDDSENRFWPSSFMKLTSSSKSNVHNSFPTTSGDEEIIPDNSGVYNMMGNDDQMVSMISMLSARPNLYSESADNHIGSQAVQSQTITVTATDEDHNDKDLSKQNDLRNFKPVKRQPSFDFETRDQHRFKQHQQRMKMFSSASGSIANNQIISNNDFDDPKFRNFGMPKLNGNNRGRQASFSTANKNIVNAVNNVNDAKMIFDDDGQQDLVFTSAEIDNGNSATVTDNRFQPIIENNFPKLTNPSSSSLLLQSETTTNNEIITSKKNENSIDINYENLSKNRNNNNDHNDNNDNDKETVMNTNNKAIATNDDDEESLLWKQLTQTPDPFEEFYDNQETDVSIGIDNNDKDNNKKSSPTFLQSLNDSLIDYDNIRWKPIDQSMKNNVDLSRILDNPNTVSIDNNPKNNISIDEQQQQKLESLKTIAADQFNSDEKASQQMMMLSDSNRNNNNNDDDSIVGHHNQPPKLSKLSELLSLNGLFNAIQNQNVKAASFGLPLTILNQTNPLNMMGSANNNNGQKENEVFFKRQPLSSLATMMIPSITANMPKYLQQQTQQEPLHLQKPQTVVTKLMASFSARPLKVSGSDDLNDDNTNHELIHKIGAKFSVSGNPVSFPTRPSSSLTADNNLNLNYNNPNELETIFENHPQQLALQQSQPMMIAPSIVAHQVALPYLTIEPNTNKVRRNRVLKNMKFLMKAINRIYRL